MSNEHLSKSMVIESGVIISDLVDFLQLKHDYITSLKEKRESLSKEEYTISMKLAIDDLINSSEYVLKQLDNIGVVLMDGASEFIES